MLEKAARTNVAGVNWASCVRRITDLHMVIGALGVENFYLALQGFGAG